MRQRLLECKYAGQHFKTAIQEAIKENSESSINPITKAPILQYPDEDPKAFRNLIHWLEEDEWPKDKDGDLDISILFIRAWVLGKRVGIRKFCDSAIFYYMVLIESQNLDTNWEDVHEALMNTKEGDPLRDLVMEELAYECIEQMVSFHQQADQLSLFDDIPNFLYQFIVATQELYRWGFGLRDRLRSGRDNDYYLEGRPS